MLIEISSFPDNPKRFGMHHADRFASHFEFGVGLQKVEASQSKQPFRFGQRSQGERGSQRLSILPFFVLT